MILMVLIKQLRSQNSATKLLKREDEFKLTGEYTNSDSFSFRGGNYSTFICTKSFCSSPLEKFILYLFLFNIKTYSLMLEIT